MPWLAVTTGSSASTEVVTPSGSVMSLTRLALADLEVGDVDGEARRDVGRLGRDEQRLQDLVDHAALAGDRLGLALEVDGDLDVDGLVEVDADEVDVEHVAAHGVALHVLHQGGRAVAVDLEVDDGVEALLGDQRGAQLAPLHREGDRVGPEAVDHAGDLALAAEAAGGAGALRGARGCREDDLGHRRAPTSEIAPERNSIGCGPGTVVGPGRPPGPTWQDRR